MELQFFFKQMETSASLEAYAREKVEERINRFMTKPTEAQMVFTVQHGKHRAQLTVKGGDGANIEVSAESPDMYASVDGLIEKLTVQLKRHKEKLKHHKGHANVRDFATYAQSQKARYQNEGPEYIDAEDILKYEEALKRRRV